MRPLPFFIHSSLFRRAGRGQRGAISIPLILVLVVIVVFASLELGALVVSQTEISGTQSRSQVAFRAAETGAHDALKRISRDFTYTCTMVDCYSIDSVVNGCMSGDGCAYVQVTGTGVAGDPKVITSRGVSGGAQRTIQVTAELDASLDGKIVSTEWTEVLVGSSVSWPGGWAYRKAITIQSAQVSGSANLMNFPMLIDTIDLDWRSQANGGNVAQDDGGDIIFTAANGSTQLSHEIESYNPVTGELVAWVKIPSLDYDDDTTVYVYYGNSAGGLHEQDGESVWDSNYQMVLHMDESTGNTMYDSTANGAHGTKPSATVPAPTAGGQINGAQSFDGSGDRIEAASVNLPTGNYTYSTWVNMTAVDDESFFMASDGTGANEFVVIAHTQVDVISNNATVLTTAGSIPTSDQTYLTVTRSADLITVYIDGAADANTANEGGAYAFGSCQLLIGADNDSSGCADSLGNYVSGIMDEVRVSDIARSADWIQTEYNNQNSPGTFYSIGLEEQGAGWPSGWAYRNQITIDNAQVSGSANHANFPVLISTTNTDWRSVANGGDVEQDDGGDIRFAASDGVLKLSHEIESYNPTTGELVAWVKVPVLDFDTDTQIFMYYGNNSGGLDEQDVAGAWSGYNNVWHLNEQGNGTSSEYVDSAGAAHGTGHNLDADEQVVGQVGNANRFDGANDYLSLPSVYNTSGALPAFAVTAWVNLDATDTGGYGLLDYDRSEYFNTHFGNGSNFDATASGGLIHFSTTDSGSSLHDMAGSDISNTGWRHVAWVYDGTDKIIYLDGVADNTALNPHSGNAIGNGTTRYGIIGDGSEAGSEDGSRNAVYFDGAIDELRFVEGSRSADWIQTEYNNQNSPGTFYSVGAQETP